MPKKRFQPEEIIGKLRHAPVRLVSLFQRILPFPTSAQPNTSPTASPRSLRPR